MKRLIKIGLKKVGYWILEGQNPKYMLESLENTPNILYAFISEDKVNYIGKTTLPLKGRMYGYENPGPTQITNIRVNKKIRELLYQGKPVEIYALPDNGLLYYGDFHINLAAALEDSIIQTVNPPWNGSEKGKSEFVAKKNHSRIETFPDKTPKKTPPTSTEVKLSAKSIPKFKLRLSKTYYHQGFFNVTREFDRYVGKNEEEIEFHLFDSDVVLHGRINRTANLNGTARIMGGKELKSWFQSRFKIGDVIAVEFLTANLVRLSIHTKR